MNFASAGRAASTGRRMALRHARLRLTPRGLLCAPLHRQLCSAVRAEEELGRPRYAREAYATHADAREYFYYVDAQGRLHLDEMWPKGVATALRAEKFLDFFFSRLKSNDRTNVCACMSCPDAGAQ